MDDGLWVRLAGRWSPDPAWRWTITGPAHTHRGHFGVEHPASGAIRTVHRGDTSELSPAARIWLAGYLAGQEPDLCEFLGGDDGLYAAHTDADVERWRAWCAAFRRRGFGPSVNALPPTDAIPATSGPPPWCYVGGLYRVLSGTAWSPAEPQPTRFDPERAPFWPGSACEQRGHCELTQYGDVTLCDDCHEVTV